MQTRLPAADARARMAASAWTRLRDGVLADRDRLVLWLPACLGRGILLYFGRPTEPPLWPGLAVAGLATLMFVLSRRSLIWRAVAAVLLTASIGFAVADWTAGRMPAMPDLPRRASLVAGRIGEIDLLPDGRRRLTIEAAAVGLAARPGADAPEPDPPSPIFRRLHVKLRADDHTALTTGDRVRIRAMLRGPPPPSTPGGRDPQRDAFFSGLGGSGYALSAVMQAGPAGDRPHGLLQRIRRLREAIAGRIMAVLPGPRGAVAATLLTGLASAIPQADRDAFAASGLAHLLAVAGLHLGIVMGLALTLARTALALWEWGSLRLPCRQIAALAALAAGALYMLLTGLHLPGLRSLAMAAIAVLALLIGRRAVTMRALGFAAMLLLMVNPALIFDVGFQMSFAAVLALLAGYEAARPVTAWFHGEGIGRRIALHVLQLFLTSLIAGAASLPYAAFHFGRVQFYFVLANLLAVPLTAFWVMPQGLLSLGLMPFGLDWITLRPMGAGIDMILFLARRVAALPAASLAVPAAPGWGLLCVSFGLMWLCLWRRRWRFLAVLPLACGLTSPWLAPAADLLVSGDASLIGWRAGPTLLLERGARSDPVTLSDWRRAWAIETPAVALPDDGAATSTAPEGSPPASDVTCNPAACLLTRGRQTVLLLRDDERGSADKAVPALEPDDCDGVSLVVSARPLHGECPGVPRIDRFTVWRDGPQAVWLRSGGVRIASDRTVRGRRPWVPAAPVPGGRRPTLPLAQAE